MRSEQLSGRVAVAVAAVVTVAGVAFGQGQVPPVVAPTPVTAGPQQESPGQSSAGQGQRGRGRHSGYVVATPRTPTGPTVKLPAPRARSETSIEQALWNRRTLRGVTVGQITLEEVGQLLWAAQGITGEWARRAAPSLGGAYPLEVLLMAGDVTGLPAGLYRYYPASLQLERIAEGDGRPELTSVCKFPGIEKAPAIVVITGIESRLSTVVPAGPVAHHWIAIEAGAASQNLALEAVALGLGTAPVSDSDEAKLVRILRTPPEEKPFVIVVVSRQ